MTLTAKIGSYAIWFGPMDTELGGQVLEAIAVNGNEVAASLASAAGVGIAACFVQAPGVIRIGYNSDEDLHVGGAYICRSTIVLPKYELIRFGIDDTDTKKSGVTWVLAMTCGDACIIEGTIFLDQRVVQLNPKVLEKTTNCTGSILIFAVKPEKKEELIRFIKIFIEEHSSSPATGICCWSGIKLPTSSSARRIKTELLTKADVEVEAEFLGVSFIDATNGKERIGALGALL
jgi:tRNA(Ile2) C34 agmatinyltransferase TiaS